MRPNALVRLAPTGCTAEHEASTSRARFEAAFESSPLKTAIITLDGYVVEGNKRLFDIAGPSERVPNKLIESIFLPLETDGASTTYLPTAGPDGHRPNTGIVMPCDFGAIVRLALQVSGLPRTGSASSQPKARWSRR
ncbi:hypothetical protein [Cryobacterium sp. Y82]|uniref:hypothetical protein n=1 Tax=Cryobacterium sp. Y82 TaxID=2045017 RepID=UPI0011B07B39|nr:hypothetical protein [Cryobacterium sp. Y82]